MSNFVLLYHDHSLYMGMSDDSSYRFPKFLALFCIKFLEKSPNLVKIGLRTKKKLQAKNKSRGEKHLPSAYRVNQDF